MKDLLSQIDVLESFNEGCELTDAVQSLLCAARTLTGIATESQAKEVIEIVENLITDYIDFLEAKGDEEAYGWYLDIPDKLYKTLYLSDKLSEKEFLQEH